VTIDASKIASLIDEELQRGIANLDKPLNVMTETGKVVPATTNQPR
jgi:hypothetical protein